MPKLPGADPLLHRLQGLAPLVIYVAAAGLLVWTAVLVSLGVLGPLREPKPLDPTQLIQRQEQVKAGPYETTQKYFPAEPVDISVPPNPFGG